MEDTTMPFVIGMRANPDRPLSEARWYPLRRSGTFYPVNTGPVLVFGGRVQALDWMAAHGYAETVYVRPLRLTYVDDLIGYDAADTERPHGPRRSVRPAPAVSLSAYRNWAHLPRTACAGTGDAPVRTYR